MRAERLAEIKDAVENLDTGKYYGADMVAEALVEMAGFARDLIDEIEEIREKNPILVGDRVLLKVYEDEEGPQPTEGVVTAFTSGGVIVDAGELGSTHWYPVTGVTRIED